MKLKTILKLIRIDYWLKNIFVIPGILISIFLDKYVEVNLENFYLIIISIISIVLTCSANYVLNEMEDAEEDKYHPLKKKRPIASGEVSYNLAIFIYILLLLVGLSLSKFVNTAFSFWILVLLLMGVFYNLRPIRLKDIPLIDVISESFNNVLRLLLGWSIFSHEYFPPVSLIFIFWFSGAFLMSTKRYAEYALINNKKISSKYRKSFKFYNKNILLLFGFANALFCTLFLGIFLIKYKKEFIFLIPFVVLIFTYYFNLSFKKNSIAQNPEYLIKDKPLMLIVTTFFIAVIMLFKIELSFMEIFNEKLINNLYFHFKMF